MTKDKKPVSGPKQAATREDRLKAALKSNLAKRKAQSRARTVPKQGSGKTEE